MTIKARLVRTLIVWLGSSVVVRSHTAKKKGQSYCKPYPKPSRDEHELTARWLVHSLDWGIMSTISTRDGADSNGTAPPIPFGNVISFVDGTCQNSTGTPYFYGTNLDQSFKDLSQNPTMSLTLTEAALGALNYWQVAASCSPHTHYGDPESPPCARLTLTGTFERLEGSSAEENFVRDAMFERHPVMKYWPKGHEFFFGKLVVKDLWFLDWFGGPPEMNLTEYFEIQLEEENDWWSPTKDVTWSGLTQAMNVFPWLL
mmetsp:Transcript_25289/g.30591  ORF Transcript_25289/g.30591 Transcript_25289/m.30591 type:complete len:258 (+) Transcript_25289:66-839(+)